MNKIPIFEDTILSLLNNGLRDSRLRLDTVSVELDESTKLHLTKRIGIIQWIGNIKKQRILTVIYRKTIK